MGLLRHLEQELAEIKRLSNDLTSLYLAYFEICENLLDEETLETIATLFEHKTGVNIDDMYERWK